MSSDRNYRMNFTEEANSPPATTTPPPFFSSSQQNQPHLTETEQISLLNKLGIFKFQGRDKRGHRILRIIGKFFPVGKVTPETVKKFMDKRIVPKLEKYQQFSILYIHTGVTDPAFSALRSIYDAFPVTIRNNLETVYFLHPGSFNSRLFLATFGRFLLFPTGFYGKVKYVSRVDYLWDHVKRTEMDVPDFVKEHDEELDNRPMTIVDYGIESDYPRVGHHHHGESGGEAPSSCEPIYALRCIS